MKRQILRTDTATSHPIAGKAIDRSKPLSFKLNGRLIEGYAGDSVLSALLANGIDTLGLHRGHPVGLSQRLAPAAIAVSHANQLARAIPISRLPAINGSELTLVGSHRRVGPIARAAEIVGRRPQSLGVNLDEARSMPPDWLDAPREPLAEADLIVIGGGLAGMSAAVAAAKRGNNVILVERQGWLGGVAELFGTIEGEPTPADNVARLSKAIAEHDNITILLHAEVVLLRPGRVLVHHVLGGDGPPQGKMQPLTSKRIILATGAVERLPLFSGNRLPGVTGALETFWRAWHFGVWSGSSAILASVTSAPYRLVMMASDAGIAIKRLADNRLNPQSRFIEFSKAYGMTQVGGTAPVRVEQGKGNADRLTVSLGLALEGLERQAAPLSCDQLIVCGGWQPDLSLWHGVGGASCWNEDRHRLEAMAGPDKIVLAGAAAGWISKHACLHSGTDAANQLFARKRKPVVERVIDPIYETPDGPTPIMTHVPVSGAPAYLDGGASLIGVQEPERRRLPFAKPIPWSLADQPQALEVGDVAAGVQLGDIPREQAGIIAQARSVAIAELDHFVSDAAPENIDSVPPPLVPDFLTGRFGSDPQLWKLKLSEPRALDPGALIFANSDQSNPLLAIGVIVGADHCAPIGLMRSISAREGVGLTVRDTDRPVAARLAGQYHFKGSAAPLSAEASAS
ncbi:FAD-dependent oxidoreductase [Devosia rhodophyticola]|uniref:FAD-dependent oxidoreductase n=1 Tax=Devosia rhodophyticola TaxID=3026423 RepID=A0ABY7YZE7_9HYPH|nr:FAD-dependent oxidoreductase [Devosia rhodophyticola]WDR06385.1 FAD-dependent oxidoreductase [Devosia rhodophyticola]